MKREKTTNEKAVLSVKDLSVSFTQYTKGLRKRDLKVITDLDVDLYSGKIVAVVGSSGSGKSLLAHALLNILPKNANCDGEIYYQGKLLKKADLTKLRGDEIALIPQSVNYLDPLQPVGKQVKLSIKDKSQKENTLNRIFEQYGLEKKVEKQYPFQLSGGMARKVLLATALAGNAKVIIADEPTPGLDDSALTEVLKDFKVLAATGCAILMITHDIQAALKIADHIAIFYAGTTVEVANNCDFTSTGEKLRHPYTKALNRALPENEFEPIPGFQPPPHDLPVGCLFSARCPIRTDDCLKARPAVREIRNGKVRCIHAT